MWVDSHCHLDFPEYDDDFDAVVTRAQEAGVKTLLTIGTKRNNLDQVIKVAERYPFIYCSVGIHPHESDTDYMSYEELLAYTQHEKVVGLGETGLDFYYDHSDRQAQEASFRTHIKVSRASGLPVIVHTRDADDKTIEILEDEMKKGPFKGLIHCFTASQELADRVLDLGFYISISGIVTFKKAEAVQATVKTIPLDRLLVETDAPFLAPVPFRGKRNEPAFVVHTAEAIARLKDIPLETLAQHTTNNFLTLFSKVGSNNNL